MKNCKKYLPIGIMLTAGFLFLNFGLFAQDTKSQKHVQIKILENGKTITDTTFDVNDNLDQDELNSLLREFNNDLSNNKIDNEFEFPGFDNDFFAFRLNGPMHRGMYKFNHQFDSLMNNYKTFAFDFKFDNDSILNKFHTFEFITDSIQDGKSKTFIYKFNNQRSDTIASSVPHHKGMKGHMMYNKTWDNSLSCDTIRNEKDVLVIKKKFPNKQQVIIEQKNSDVIINKGKKGEVEIIIKDTNRSKES